jgi:hypothetical protein
MIGARATMLLVLSLAGAAGFLTSYITLNAGLTAMWLRYALAGVAAYLVFLLLMRLWASRHRRLRDRDIPDLDVGPSGLGRSSGSDFEVGGGGRSGGAGASGSWGPKGDSTVLDALPDALDLSDGWIVAIPLILALGGFVAVAYVVYAAPIMLAEIAVDAAMVSAAYGHLRKGDMPRAAGLLRWTWLPASMLVATLALAGWGLQMLAPGAKSIGGVIAAMRD